jgi:hypothetical protein
MALDERSREWTLVGRSMGVLAIWQLAKAKRPARARGGAPVQLQLLPRQLSQPSRSVTAAMTSAAAGLPARDR